jgi:hypothetical protein
MRMSSKESDDPGKSPAGDAAEFAAASLLELTIRHGGARYFQGLRRPEIPCRASGEAIQRFAKERFHRVPALAAEALVAWADGVPVELLRHVPDASHVLALQARGTRCVSVLAEPGPETGVNPLEFLLHDLCHLGKFLSASHHAEQVGFFSTLQSALSHPAWISAAARLDEHFSRDLDHVASDMNGSSVYLFAVLKMKIKMAARRQLARERGVAPPIGGPLSSDEQGAFGALLNVLLDAFHFDDTLRSAAFATSARRDAPEMATLLTQHFSSVGRAVLDAQRVTPARVAV